MAIVESDQRGEPGIGMVGLIRLIPRARAVYQSRAADRDTMVAGRESGGGDSGSRRGRRCWHQQLQAHVIQTIDPALLCHSG